MRAWQDTSSGIHSFFTAGEPHAPSFTRDFINSFAYRYTFAFNPNPTILQQIIDANPGFISGTYEDITQGWMGLPWYLQNHPDWLIRKCPPPHDPLLTYDYQAAFLDFTNPDVVAHYFAHLGNTECLALDNMGLANPTGTPDGQACGIINATGWHQLFAGVGGYAGVTDPQYTAAMLAYMAKTRDFAHSRGNLICVNTDPMVVAADPDTRWMQQLVSSVDGVLMEVGGISNGWTGDPRKIWLRNIRFIEAMQAAGKAVFTQEWYSYQISGPPPNQRAVSLRQYTDFTLAAYLLAKGSACSVIIRQTDIYDHEAFGGLYWPQEFENCYQRIGTATGPMVQTAGVPETEIGLYAREYTGGIAICNPSLPDNTFSMDLSSLGPLTDLSGNPVGSIVTLPKMTGVVLLKVNPSGASSGVTPITPPITVTTPPLPPPPPSSVTNIPTTEPPAPVVVAEPPPAAPPPLPPPPSGTTNVEPVSPVPPPDVVAAGIAPPDLSTALVVVLLLALLSKQK